MVSVTETGALAAEDSGRVPFDSSGSALRRPEVSDEGWVLFLSQAPLSTIDNNGVVDGYAWRNGNTQAVDLAGNPITGNCSFIAWDDSETVVHGIRYNTPGPLDTSASEYLRENGNLQVFSSVLENIRGHALTSDGTLAVTLHGTSEHIVPYMRDLTTGDESVLFESSSVDTHSVSVSDDGEIVVFASDGVFPGIPDSNGVLDVYSYDRATATFHRLSTSDRENGEPCRQPVISGDGSVTAFVTPSDVFLPGGTGNDRVILVGADGFECASDGPRQRAANGDAHSPDISAKGRFVVFASDATNLVDDTAPDAARQIYLRDRDTGRTTLLSADNNGMPSDADCHVPAISASGRYIAFVSRASNLAPESDGNAYQVYRVDRGPGFANHAPRAWRVISSGAMGESIPVTLDAEDQDEDALSFKVLSNPTGGAFETADGEPIAAGTWYHQETLPWRFVPETAAAFSETVHYIAYDGRDTSLPAELEVRGIDPERGRAFRVSLDENGGQVDPEAAGGIWNVAYSALDSAEGGHRIVFATNATLSAADDDEGFEDVYLHDVRDGRTILVSEPGAQFRNAHRCTLSGDGRNVAYYDQNEQRVVLYDVATTERLAVASGLAATTPSLDFTGENIVFAENGGIHKYNVVSADTSLVSVNNAGESADASCSDPVVSTDGRVVAFTSTASNLADTGEQVYRRIFMRFLDHDTTVLASVDGQGNDLGPASRPRVSASGRFVAFLCGQTTALELVVKDMKSGALETVSAGAGNHDISADGRFVSYSLEGQVYRYDRQSQTSVLVSNHAGEPANGTSTRTVISGKGRFVSFLSEATDLIGSADTNGISDVFVNDLGIPDNEPPGATFTSMHTREDVPVQDQALTWSPDGGRDVTVFLTSPPSQAAEFDLSGWSPDGAFPTITYIPRQDFHGKDSFGYQLLVGGELKSTVTVDITVESVNDLPVIVAPTEHAMAEDSISSLTVEASDADGDDVQLELAKRPQNGEARFERESSGGAKFTLVYAPDEDFFGGDRIEFKAFDGSGDSTPHIIDVTITPVNDPPVFKMQDDLVLDNAEQSGTIAWNDPSAQASVTISDVDDPIEQLSVRVTEAPLRGELKDNQGSVVDSRSLSASDFPLVYKPVSGTSGKDIILMQASDGSETVDAGFWVAVGEVEVMLELTEGWNLFSIPVVPAASRAPVDLLTDPSSGAPLYEGSVWTWDARKRTYRVATRLTPGHGYWAYCPPDGAQTIALRGHPSGESVRSLAPGWHLIGPVGYLRYCRLEQRGENLQPKPLFWTWTQDRAVRPPDLSLGRGAGYWIFLFEHTNLDLELNDDLSR